MNVLRYFRWVFFYTLIGLFSGSLLGWIYSGTFSGAFSYFFICCTLSILEISLSFDNAIVNAKLLQDFSQKWKKRFLVWGIIGSIFGMRIVFPIFIIMISTKMNPFSVIYFAIWNPQEYSNIMKNAYPEISGFGGTFLLMISLRYFFDYKKNIHWFISIEKWMKKQSYHQGVIILITLIIVLFFYKILHQEHKNTFLEFSIYGIFSFLFLEIFESFFNASKAHSNNILSSSLSTFIYLEFLDASFSLDSVIGAFALSNNIFIIAIGLGIGAIYVRSITIMLVEKNVLSSYRYLEHGAFYSILVLSIIMYTKNFFEISDIFLGFMSLFFILLSFYSSIKYNQKIKNFNQ